MDKPRNIENLFNMERKPPATRKTVQYRMGVKEDKPQEPISEIDVADEMKELPKEPAIRKSDKYNQINRSLLLEKLNRKNAKIVGIA